VIARLFCPTSTAPSLPEVDVDDLRSKGIEFLILDLDNTIVAWQRSNVSDEVIRWVRDARESGMKLCVASNTRNPRRLSEIAGMLGIPFVCRAAKPRRKAFRTAMDSMGAEPERTAVIGDQIFTDVVGGNRAGLHTILVTPIHRREFIGTKVSRLFESLVLYWLRRRGLLGTKRGASQSEMKERA